MSNRWSDRDEVPEYWQDDEDDDLPPWVDKFGTVLGVLAVIGMLAVAVRIAMQGVG